MKRKHEAEGTQNKDQPGNIETPLQTKKRKAHKIDREHGEQSSKSIEGPPKGSQKKKKKRGLKDVRDTFDIPPNQERKKNNSAELDTKTENKPVSHKRKKIRKNNKYKDLNIKQKAEKIAQNCTESKDFIGNKVQLEQQHSGSIEKNVNMFSHSPTSKKLRSSPKKEVENENKVSLFESKFNVLQESSIGNKNKDSAKNIKDDINILGGHKKMNHDHSSATSADVMKKIKKKLTKKFDTSGSMENGGTGEKLYLKEKNKINGKNADEGNNKKKKRLEKFMFIEKPGGINSDKQVGEVKKIDKEKSKSKMIFKVEDIVSTKKANFQKQETEGKSLKAEDSEVEDMIFDGNEEFSEKFSNDFDALLSSLNFNQFNSTKKLKKKNSGGGKSVVRNSQDMLEMKDGRDSLGEKWEDENDRNTKGMMGKKRKRNNAKIVSKEISGKQNIAKTQANNTVAAEEPNSPIKKSPKFNREKLSKLLEKAADMEQKKPSPAISSHPTDKLKQRMEDRLTAARFR